MTEGFLTQVFESASSAQESDGGRLQCICGTFATLHFTSADPPKERAYGRNVTLPQSLRQTFWLVHPTRRVDHRLHKSMLFFSAGYRQDRGHIFCPIPPGIAGAVPYSIRNSRLQGWALPPLLFGKGGGATCSGKQEVELQQEEFDDLVLLHHVQGQITWFLVRP